MKASELSKFIVDRLLAALESQARARAALANTDVPSAPEGPLKPTVGDMLDPWSAPGLNEEPPEVDDKEGL